MSSEPFLHSIEAPALSREQESILTQMAVTLLLLQSAESVINLCMTFVFQKEEPLTMEKLLQQQKNEQNKTLGFFLRELRKRVDLDPNFDQMLREFLESRNTFIHDLNEVPGFGLDSPQARQVAARFVGRLMRLTKHMVGIFAGFVRAWERQINMPIPIPPGSERIFAEIDRVYTPVVDQLVFEKKRA